MPSPLPLIAVTLLAVALAGCAEPVPTPVTPSPALGGSTDVAVLEPDTVEVSGVYRARARIQPVAGGDVEGVVTLTYVQGGTRVNAQLDGLSRQEYHALQILRGRECGSDPDVHLGADLGTPHGGPYSPPGQRHAGDLGSVRGDGGSGRYDRIATDLDLSGTASPVGRALVVRQLRDDAVSPGGAAGAVIGCGIIEGI